MRKLVVAVVAAMLASSSVALAISSGFAPGTTTRVSVATDGTPAGATTGGQVISQDGRYVVFASAATNLVSLSTGGRQEVYRRDRVNNVTELVSLTLTGLAAGGLSFAPTVSADGRFVAFLSSATDLVANDTNGAIDVFVRDMTLGTTVAASTDATGALVSGGGSLPNFPGARAISDDGRYVVFTSTSTQLVTDANGGVAQVYVKDLSTGAVVRASVDATGAAANAASQHPVISGDGKVVAFESTSTNLSALQTSSTLEVYVRDLVAGTTVLGSVSDGGVAAGQGATTPGLSRDGRYLVFETPSQLTSSDTDFAYDVYLRDLTAGTTTLASPGSGTGDSRAPAVSGDGAYVAFNSIDSTLVSGDANNVNDVYLWSRVTGQLTLVSLNDAGAQANSGSTFPSVSSNGGSVLFSSTASNLVSSPLTSAQQLYVRDLATDAAPVVAPLADASVAEGVTFSAAGSFSDPDGSTSWTASVDWGDGAGAQPLLLAQDKTFALAKLLAPGTYTVTVAVTDGEGLTGTGTFALTVNNVAPSVNAGSDAQVALGATFAGSGSFTDPGASEHYSATVDYGDGSGVVALPLAADDTFALSHAYAAVGTYTVTVTVGDDHGGLGSDSLSVAVVPGDTFAWLSPTPSSVNLGRTLPVHFTVNAPDGSFVLDKTVSVKIVDAGGVALKSEVWSATPSAGVSTNDSTYSASFDTTGLSQGVYSIRVSFSSPALNAWFSRPLSVGGGGASPQHALR